MSESTNIETRSAAPINLLTLISLLAAIVAITPLAIDLYLPAMLLIAKQLGTTMASVQNTLSIYLAGYALGLLLFGPLADMFGRRRLVMIGLTGFVVCCLLLPLQTSIEGFMALRAVQAFLGSAATVVVPGTIRQFYGKDTAKGMSYVSMIMMFAPMLAPTIGSFILVFGSWQWMFYLLAIYGIALIFFAARYLPEMSSTTDAANFSQFLKNYYIVLGDKQARKNVASSMLAAFAFFCYLTAIPSVYLDVYQTSEFLFSFLFALNVLALMLAQFINTRLVGRRGSLWILKRAIILGIVFAAALFTANWLYLPLLYTVLTLLPLMSCLSLIAVSADSLILIRFSEQTGTATAVIGTAKFGIGSLAGPILALFATNTAVPFTLLMLLAVVFIAVIQLPSIARNATG
ncbi:Bcr/CflA family efflux MFS transporter [Thalassotalea sp. PS06]|uniref:Bcr/CflA family efflux MFS transporter n=1 Tax=Thalassotalea sp. PS06 TaxID=2594005 RepID=UPI0011659BBC|nr:Bcr/CflA family efflux MFS transporter [Thalassotalea sp. PS06]QDP02461.1 multidrug effflux MFS transporter [Thalassotalea sp. PS06]